MHVIAEVAFLLETAAATQLIPIGIQQKLHCTN